MIELSNTIAQTINPGDSATFDTVIAQTGSNECHRRGTGAIRIRNFGSCNNRALYEVQFNGNISATTAGTQPTLAIALSGDTLTETTMVSTITAADDIQNISAHTFLTDCDSAYDRVTVTNIGDVAAVLSANPSFSVRRFS